MSKSFLQYMQLYSDIYIGFVMRAGKGIDVCLLCREYEIKL